jgi:hypothetical protein
MAGLATHFRKAYGAHPLHLLTMLAGFALLGYALVTFSPDQLFNHATWWQSIAVWFAAAVVAHDLVLFPLYALGDRVLFAGPGSHRRPNVLIRNHIRIPALGAALTLLVFLPGIIRQGAATYLAATGQTQEPFLGRWLLLTAAMFGASAAVYVARRALRHRSCSSEAVSDDGGE